MNINLNISSLAFRQIIYLRLDTTAVGVGGGHMSKLCLDDEGVQEGAYIDCQHF